jgi:hypothetical protein
LGLPLSWQLLLVLLFFGASSLAQVSTATLLGLVQDSSKASLPAATVKLINIQTGAENDSVTNREGAFFLNGVLPGAYTLRIERGGFATTQVSGITLNVGDAKTLLIRMKVGSITESVQVDASGLTINTTDASVSTVVDRQFVGTMPLNGRSFQDLISMTPGIVTQNPQAAGRSGNTQGEFSVNGQRPLANSFLVDGVSANVDSGTVSGATRLVGTGSAAGSTALGTTQSLTSIDALQEFRVLSSTYSAEYGRTPGGQFSFLTRSGANTVHGSLFLYARNDVFEATDWFTNTSYGGNNEQYQQNDFGGTLGGPVILPRIYSGRDKTFFFFSYEGLYLPQPTPQTFQYAPSVHLVAEAPSALRPVLATFPDSDPEIRDASGNLTGLAALSSGHALPSHVNATSVRIDRSFSPRFSAFFRYGGTPSYSQTSQLFSLTANRVGTQTVTFGATNQVSSTKSNDLRVGYIENTSKVNTRTQPSFLSLPAADLNTGIGIPASYSAVSSEAYIRIQGVGDTESNTDQASGSLHQWNVRDTFSLQAGNHLLKFGIDQRRIASKLTPPALSVQADFFDRASLVNNLAPDLVITRAQEASPILNEFSAFSDDEWRVSSFLSLSLGLRWEVNPPPNGSNGIDAYTARGDVTSPATLSLAPRGSPLWHTSWYNFAPRLGAAWIVDSKPDRELVLRVGSGVFFDTGTQPALGAFNGIGFDSSVSFQNVPLPVTQSQLDFSTGVVPPYTNTTVFAFPSHLQLPYSLQWNVALEKAFNQNQTLTVSYVGANGRRLLQEQRRNVNQSNPTFGDVYYFPRGLTSSYQALQMKFQRTLSHGLQALASYTWAHALDYGSTDPAFPLARGNADLDVRQNLEAAISWNLPSFPGNHLAKSILGNWSVDGRLIARTAFPVNLAGNMSFDSVTGSTYYSGVNLIPNRPLYLYSKSYPGGRMFNGGPVAHTPAFTLPDGAEQGDAPRNYVRGFSAVQLNLAARRQFHLHDRLSLDLGAEAFNLLNHPNFGYVDPYLTDALFGQSTKMLYQSFGATGSLYQQGGPRSMQFELKLVF